MSAWTYYSPLWLGTILAGIVGYSSLDQLPPMATGLLWTVFVLGCLVVGVHCQLVMIGAQGVFAQVLPAPGGRSIRGRAAVVGGSFLFGWVLFAVVAALLRTEGMPRAPIILGAAGLVCLAGAVITYVWCWPTALRDFEKRAV
jgi:hypothetical protein